MPTSALEAILPHAPLFAAALSRVAGAILFMPLLSGSSVPRIVKAMLVLAITFSVYPALDHTAWAHTAGPAGSMDLWTVAPVIASEMLVGFSIGAIAGLPIYCLQLAGVVVGQQMGLSLAGVFDPTMDVETEAFGQMLSILSLAAFAALGGIEAVFDAVIVSFEHAPMGSVALDMAPLGVAVGLLQAGYELAIRVAMPVLCVVFLETLATGMVMKTVPQLNVLTIGFPVKVLMGITLFAASLVAADEVIVGGVLHAIQSAQLWSHGL